MNQHYNLYLRWNEIEFQFIGFQKRVYCLLSDSEVLQDDPFE